jgi:hypothetical protein
MDAVSAVLAKINGHVTLDEFQEMETRLLALYKHSLLGYCVLRSKLWEQAVKQGKTNPKLNHIAPQWEMWFSRMRVFSLDNGESFV